MQWRVRAAISGDTRETRIRHVAGCLTCTLRCAHCGLPVRLDGPADHPGHGVVDHFAGLESGLPDLGLLHRFCRTAVARGKTGGGLALRRAHLGRATEQYETGRRAGRYQCLGVRSSRAASADLFRKHWRMAKMRYACKACRYYTASH